MVSMLTNRALCMYDVMSNTGLCGMVHKPVSYLYSHNKKAENFNNLSPGSVIGQASNGIPD